MAVFSSAFQRLFGSDAAFNAFEAFCDASLLLQDMLAQFGGTIDITRDSQGRPLPNGGTGSTPTLISVDPTWLTYDANGQLQASRLYNLQIGAACLRSATYPDCSKRQSINGRRARPRSGRWLTYLD